MTKVWVNGTFDVLHVGHIRLLEFAKSLGNRLIIGIDSDERTRLLKGKERPFNDQSDRMEMLKAIKYVDDVMIFNTEEELISILKSYDPDVFVVGKEYENKKIIGREVLRKIVYYDRIPNYSSTCLINKKRGT